MFKELKEINSRPSAFQFYTAADLWTDEHTSKRMLEFHLNESIDVSSRKTEFIERSVDWIAAHFGVDEQTEIADFGCGPGLYTNRLAARGARVTGIDFSKRSIDFAGEAAKEKGFDVHYVTMNYLDYETADRFDLILMIMCDYCALSPEQRTLLLRKFHDLLKPEGSVLLDVYSLKSYRDKEEAALYEHNHLDGLWSSREYFAFINTFKYDTEKVILDKYTIIEETRTRVVYNWLQHFSRDSLAGEFEKNGFRIVGEFADVAGSPFDPESGEFALIAQKL